MPQRVIITLVALIFGVIGCGASLMTVTAKDLEGLKRATLASLQFYSGSEDIVFQVQTDEIIREVKRESLSLTNLSTEHRLTIRKKTPGTVARFDPISLEIHMKFDADIPSLIYMDEGSGLELVTFEFTLNKLVYERVLARPRDNRGRIARSDHRFLTVKKRDESKKKKNKRKAKGLRATTPK